MNRTRFGAGWSAALAAILLASPASAVIDNQTKIDVNSISCFVTNHDSYAYDISGGVSGLEWPKGSGKTAVFAAGIWVGAQLDDATNPTVKVGEYSWQWGPGILNADGTPEADSPNNHVFKIKRGDTAASNPDYANWPASKGAPTNPDGSPQILGDETLWTVFNDRASTVSNNRAGTAGTDAAHSLGLEIQQTTFAFSRNGPLNNCIFLKFKLINKGGHQLHDTYVSIWADPDLGDASEDLVGCDTLLSVGYIYNSTNNDGIYGLAPPAVGWDFFQGPLVNAATGERLGMTSFVHYINGKDPQSATGSYNNMKGLNQDGTPLVNPETGEVTKFDASGDPVTQTGFLDPDAPADRRLMLSTGPFNMAPGDTQEIVTGVIVGKGSNNFASINAMKQLDVEAQFAFDANFDLANPPPAPKAVVRPLNNLIDISWDDSAVSDFQHKVFYQKDNQGNIIDSVIKEYYFQGYNVYQALTPAGPWKKVATFDLDLQPDGETPDTVLNIYNDIPDPTTGQLQRVVVQTGTNSGVRFHYTTDQDQINGGRIVNNKPYYFAVTAYNYEALHGEPYLDLTTHSVQGLVTETLENDPSSQALTIIPGSSTAVFSVDAEHTSGTGELSVHVDFFHPDSANDHTYELTFFENPEGDPPLLGRITDVNTGEVVLDDISDFSGELPLTSALGNFDVQIALPYLIDKVTYTPSANDPFTGVSGSVYHGGLQLAREFTGASRLADAQLVPIELRFDPAGGQRAYAYKRGAGDVYEGFGTVPFTAWDVSVTPNRQINVAYIQNAGDTTDTDPPRWLPDNSDLGGREYLFPLLSTYSETELPEYTEYALRPDAAEVDMMYAFWLRRTSATKAPQAGDVLRIDLHRAVTTNDKFRFQFNKPGTVAGSEVNNDMSKIRVVPNPYLTHSIYEQTQFNRRVKFTHLPAKRLKIKIYNLAGDLVRTISRDDVSQAETIWDLKNEQALPVASGVYIYRVETADGERVVGRLAVFLEREKLNFF